jgi:choline dehydrogenase-like flavoprotein
MVLPRDPARPDGGGLNTTGSGTGVVDWGNKYGRGVTSSPSTGSATSTPAGSIKLGDKNYVVGAAFDVILGTQDKQVIQDALRYVLTLNPSANINSTAQLNGAFNKLLTSYSTPQNVKTDFNSWLVTQADVESALTGGGSGTSTFLQPSITTKDNAFTYFNSLMRDYIGSDASNEDFKSYYKELNKLEKTKVAKQVTNRNGSVTTQTTTGGVTNEDREALALKYVSKYIDTKGIENAGGAIGGNLRTIRQLASDYNVSLTDKEIRQFALSGLTDKNAVETIKTKIQNTAKATYQNLSPFIDQGLSVKDIASQYINKMANVLEINPDTIKLDDKYIQSALSTLPNFGDFNKMLRNTPMWEYTQNARDEAAGYANRILQDFGLR